jgi:hypothetical protein
MDTIRPGFKLCGACGTHVRELRDSHIPVMQEWWVWFPPSRHYPKRGWWSNSALGIPLLHNEVSTPSMPREIAETETEADKRAHDAAEMKTGGKSKQDAWMKQAAMQPAKI